MKITTRVGFNGSNAEVLRPLLEACSYKPLRYLADVLPQHLCDWWLEEVVAALEGHGGKDILAEVDGCPVGFCVIGDLPWESAILNKKMAAVKHMAAMPGREHAEVVESLVSTALEWTRDSNYDFLLCKTYTDDFTTIHALERQGFLLVDTLLDFVVDLRRFPNALQTAVIPAGMELRLAGPADLAGLVEVSRRAFAFHPGRFHVDARLGPECSKTIYERWIESCLNGWADWVVVAETAGKIAGYSAWKRPSKREMRHKLDLGHYSIGAVHPDFHGQGLFSALTLRGTELLESLATRIEGPTHINNYGVHRGYIKLGWRIEDAHHSFHKWLRG